MGADVLRTNIIAKLERSCFVSSAVLVAPTTPSRKTLPVILMKHFAIILLLILGLYSCSNKTQDIDGTWILSNFILSNGDIGFVDIGSRVLLKIDGDKLKIRKFRTE